MRRGRRRKSAPHRTAALAVLAIATVAGAGGADGQAGGEGEVGRGASAAEEAEEAGRFVDWDWSLRGLDGERFSLARYRGRPLVLNVWATWCAPCVRELASLERLARALEDAGVAVLAVSPEDAERARTFLRRHGYEIPAAVEDQRMPASFGLEALPTTWVIDPEGRIVLWHRGAAEWNQPAVRALILERIGLP